jgi:hypothetical protein
VSDVFQIHESFDQPDPDQVVWRYLTFTKFVSLLETQALWFSPPQHLGDPWEGAWTRANVKRMERVLEFSEPIEDRGLKFRQLLELMYVNCWHMNDTESAAMWRLYLTSSTEGVVIRSTWRDLTLSLGWPGGPNGIQGGIVRYVDFEADMTDGKTNFFFPISTKRMSFAHENEARLVCWRPDIAPQSGLLVPVDLHRLVNYALLAPGSAPWFKALVRSVAHRYGLDRPINDSGMDAEPIRLE